MRTDSLAPWFVREHPEWSRLGELHRHGGDFPVSIMVEMTQQPTLEQLKWCEDHCAQRYCGSFNVTDGPPMMVFENARDAMLFRLKYGNEIDSILRIGACQR